MTPATFVGRQAEMAQIGELIARCRTTSRPGVAVVRGEAGSGKTRLLDEVAGRLAGVDRWRVVGHEPERHVPLAAAQTILDRLSTVPHEGSRLAALLESPQRLGQPVQVFEAARRCLVAAPPAVLVIDDLQWVDELTVALAHYLLRAARESAVSLAVVVATRPAEDSGAFLTSAARLLDPAQLLDVLLGPLSRSEGIELVSSLSPAFDHAAAELLWERAAGIPFWLTELAREPAGSPAGKEVAIGRLADLSLDGSALVAALAVAAAPTDMADLAGMLSWSAERTAAAADELIDQRVVTPTAGSLCIVHAFVKEAVLAGLHVDVTRLLHQRLADRLQQRGGDDVRVLRRALVHRRCAGESCVDLAVQMLEARDRGLLIAGDLQDLAGLANEEATANPRAGHSLLRKVAQVCTDIGRPDLARDEWLSLALCSQEAMQRADAALRASIAALECGDRRQSESLLEHSRAAGPLEPAGEIQRAAHESELHANSTEASAVPMRRASSLARALAHRRGGPDRLRADERTAYLAALQAEYYYALRTDEPLQMLELAEQLAAAADTVEGRLRSTLHRVLPLRVLGRYPEAQQTCETVRLAAVRAQLPGLTFLSGHLLAACLHGRGRLVAAAAAASEVAALGERAPIVVPSWLSSIWARSLVHEVDVSLRSWADARPHLQRLLAAEPEAHFRANIAMSIAVWAARLGGSGDDRLALEYAEASARDAEIAGCDRCSAEQTLRAAEVYARCGQDEAARTLLDRWDLRHLDPVGQNKLWRLHTEGLVLASLDPLRADESLRRAAEQAETMDARLELLWCGLDRGRLLAGIDDDHAVRVLRQTASDAHELAAASEERRARQLLRGLGVRTWRPGPQAEGTLDGLTERELSIAQMVCAGASNVEIAETLFLSRKTVERHVSNVLGKTGLRNRTQLAAKFSAQ